VIPKIGQTCPEPRTFSPSFFVSFLSPEKEMKGSRDVRKKAGMFEKKQGCSKKRRDVRRKYDSLNKKGLLGKRPNKKSLLNKKGGIGEIPKRNGF